METRRFSHWLVRAVGYDALLVSERRKLHGFVAQSLESEIGPREPRLSSPPSAVTDDELLGEILAHLDGSSVWGRAAGRLGSHWERGGKLRRGALFRVLAASAAERDCEYVDGLTLLDGCRERLGAAGDPIGAACAEAWAGLLLVRLSRYDEALAACGRAEGLLREASGGAVATLAASLCETRGGALRRQGRHDESVALLEEALTRFQAAGDRRGETDARDGLGSVRFQQGRYDESAGHHRAALGLAQAEGDQRGAARAFIGIGGVQGVRSEYAEARASFDAAVDLFRSIGDRMGVAAALNGIGSVYLEQNEPHEGLACLREALQTYREIGGRRGIASVQISIGVLLFDIGEMSEARASFEEALAISRGIGDVRGEASSIDAIGNLLAEEGALADALERHASALATFRRVGDLRGAAYALQGRAFTQFERGSYADAIASADEARAILVGLGDRRGEAYARYVGALACVAQRDDTSALEALGDAERLYRAVGDRRGIGMCHVGFGIVHDARGEYAAAADRFDRAVDEATAASSAPVTSEALARWAMALVRVGDRAKAESCLARAAEVIARPASIDVLLRIARALMDGQAPAAEAAAADARRRGMLHREGEAMRVLAQISAAAGGAASARADSGRPDGS